MLRWPVFDRSQPKRFFSVGCLIRSCPRLEKKRALAPRKLFAETGRDGNLTLFSQAATAATPVGIAAVGVWPTRSPSPPFQPGQPILEAPSPPAVPLPSTHRLAMFFSAHASHARSAPDRWHARPFLRFFFSRGAQTHNCPIAQPPNRQSPRPTIGLGVAVNRWSQSIGPAIHQAGSRTHGAN